MKFNVSTLWPALGLACFLVSALAGRAQQVIRLIEYTNVWSYDQSGSDLGTAWKEPDYDDSSWPTGRGLLGLETNVPPPYPIPLNTPLSAGISAATTYYFRTSFNIVDVPSALTALRATYYADDGCVIYLNGMEVARTRVPDNQDYLTGTGIQNVAPYEGHSVTLDLSLDALRPGINVLAAEVHQSAPGSSDIVWGLKLRGIIAEPIEIVGHPGGITLPTGETNTFTVQTTGGPVSYQWYKDDIALAGATNQSLKLSGVTTNNSGTYRAAASNYFGQVVSTAAVLKVTPPKPTGSLDFSGPEMIQALSVPFQTAIDIVFSEALAFPSLNTTTLSVRRIDDDSIAPISSVLLSGRTVRLRLNGSNWTPDGSVPYVVVASGVYDTSSRKNTIAPNSRMPVTFTNHVNLIPADALWSCHTNVFANPSVIEEKWFDPEYSPGPDWAIARGPFAYAGATVDMCDRPIQTALPFQYHPTIFRTEFDYPSGQPTTVDLRFVYAITDGLVIYLNGQEVHRVNLLPAPADLTADTTSLTSGVPGCNEVTVGKVVLRPGRNVVACAIFQYRNGQNYSDSGAIVYSMIANAIIRSTPTLPEIDPPLLMTEFTSLPALRLSWTGPGFALESTTNLNLGHESYPAGPWIEVPNMSNPYTNSLTTDPVRFFRLRR